MYSTRTAVVVLLTVVAIVATGCGGSDTAAGIVETVSAGDAYEIIESAPEGLVILDVRREEEYDEAHIPGAVNIDSYNYDFESRLDGLDRSAPYVVYCRTDNRSADVLLLMQELGFTEVYEIDGGIVSWAESGLPLSFP